MHLELTFKPGITIALHTIYRMLFLTALRFFDFFHRDVNPSGFFSELEIFKFCLAIRSCNSWNISD